MASPSGRPATRWIASSCVAVGVTIRYARLPQQVDDGDGRATLALGLGTDNLPSGRDVLAIVGLGSMWTGLVPPPNIDHRLSSSSYDARGA
jgi:hypothetical protein